MKVNLFYFATLLNVHFVSYSSNMISLFSCVCVFFFLAAVQSSEKYTFADIIFGNEQVCSDAQYFDVIVFSEKKTVTSLIIIFE